MTCRENPNQPRPAPATSARLRARPKQAAFHIILVQPEIPPNTGNIGRLCAATGAHLHLVEPLGFRIDEQAVRRAGLDYWPLVTLHTHSNFDRALSTVSSLNAEAQFWYFSGKARRSYLQAPFQPGDALIFGCESTGLPEQLLEENQQQTLGIPTLGAVRSLNLANCVAITLYEALRQTGELSEPQLGE